MRGLLLFCFVVWFAFSAQAEKTGYKIEMTLDNFELDSIILASYYGQSNKITDTIVRNKQGTFLAKGDETLEGGVYLVILPPENKYFELLIDKEQVFSLTCDVSNPVQSIRTKGSEENRIFYEYLNFIADMRIKAEEIGKRAEAAKNNEVELDKIREERENLDGAVNKYIEEINEKYPRNIAVLIMNSAKQVEMPERLKGEDADPLERYSYYKKHYFDHFDLSDDRLLRTNFFHKRVTYYVEKLTPQNPDSIATSVDYLLSNMRQEGDLFRYYLAYFLNEYAKSKIVGMDAVYVHIVKNYYQQGKAPWTDDETLEKIIENATRLEPILIGKTAPDIKLIQKDGTPVILSEVQSPYTILYFWDTDCGHCKKASPKMVEFHDKWKTKGVKMIAVCTKLGNEVKKCWETIDERKYDWLNVVDPYHQSRYKTLYDLKSTPQIFILDENKKIIMKRIGAEQLDDVMDKIIENEQKRKEEGK